MKKTSMPSLFECLQLEYPHTFLAAALSPIFLNTWTTDETFQQSRKQDFFRQILKSAASIYESSEPQLF